MNKKINSATAVARASVQRNFLDTRMARQNPSLAAYAHELELVQESYQFGFATQHEVANAENRLLQTWRQLIAAPQAGSSAHGTGGRDGKHH